MMATASEPQFSILVINPNTSTHMTDALAPILENQGYADVRFDYFTAPESETVTLPDGRVIHGIPSIDSGEDSAKSALHCWPFVEPLVPKYDAFLVACYSAHPLVGMLRDAIEKSEDATLSEPSSASLVKRKYVTGIFEASVLASLSLISSFQLIGDTFDKSQARSTFGIVTTGRSWATELDNAVTDMLVKPEEGRRFSTLRFIGVETTGLTAVELHTTSPEEVRRRISDAARRLLEIAWEPVGAICLGCAGMAGMEEAVREGCIEAYGPKQGNRVRIVDGVVAGAGMLVTACKAGF